MDFFLQLEAKGIIIELLRQFGVEPTRTLTLDVLINYLI